MANIKRKMVKEKASVDLYSLCEGGLKDVREYLDQLAEQYGESAKLHLEWYYEDVSIYIEYERLETVKEAERRVKATRKARERRKAAKIKQEEQERKELARLLEKYGQD